MNKENNKKDARELTNKDLKDVNGGVGNETDATVFIQRPYPAPGSDTKKRK